MGYACPVCGAEQADAEHLANHLAITASLGREDHEAWLAEHAPDWANCTPAELAAIVAEHAPAIETPAFDASGTNGTVEAPPTGLESELARQSRQPGRGGLNADVEDVLAEARELTAEMQDADGGTDASGAESADGQTNENG